MIPVRPTHVLAGLAAGVLGVGARADDRLTAPLSTSVDLDLVEQALEAGDLRVLVLGDSFSVPSWNRVFPEVLNHWRFGPLTGVAGGSLEDAAVTRGVPLAGPYSVVASSSGGTYEMLRSTADVAHFALPVGFQEAFFDGAFSVGPAGELMRIEAMNASPAPTFALPGDRLLFRLLYWRAPILSVARVVIDGQLVDLDGAVSHVSSTPDQLKTFAGGSTASFLIEADPNTLATDVYFHPVGGVFHVVDQNEEPAAGLYYTYLADSSWDYVGFGEDIESQAGEKRFTIDQMSHWIDATTIDASQPVVVFYYLAAETVDDMATGGQGELEAMIDKTNAAMALSGVQSAPIHCLVLPHYHGIVYAGSSLPRTNDLVRSWFEAQRDAMFRIAEERADVAAVSLYDATVGRLGFRYLDQFRVHPNASGAQYYANCLSHLLGGPLVGDADGDGLIEFADVTLVLANWLEPGPLGDANLDGWVDFADITAILSNWNSPCRR